MVGSYTVSFPGVNIGRLNTILENPERPFVNVKCFELCKSYCVHTFSRSTHPFESNYLSLDPLSSQGEKEGLNT